MKTLYLLTLVILTLLFLHASAITRFEQETSASERILACYYRGHIINDTLVPYDVCTHIIFAFGKMTPNGIEPGDTSDVNSYRTLVKLKQKNPQLKITISLQQGFTSVVLHGTKSMQRFLLAAVDFLNKYGLDGVDFDWEFPSIQQKDAFAEFIKIASRVLHSSNKTLSLALPGNIPTFENGYYPDTINKYVDYATVMTYDFAACEYKGDNVTEFNSPLYPSSPQLASTSTSLKNLLSKGVQANKMLLGYPTYGRSWKLANPSDVGPHVPSSGCTDTPYYLLQDLCKIEKIGGKTVKDTQAGAEYMTFNDTWVSFNGMWSAAIETDWLKPMKLAGVGVWTLEDDDPYGVCGLGKFPVLTKIRSYLSN